MVRRRLGLGRGGAAVAARAAAPGGKPNLNDVVSQVNEPEVVAVRAEPAEVAPGGTVEYTALYIGPAGPITSGAIDWAFCNEPKPLAELEPVSTLCYESAGSWFADLGVGTSVSGTIGAEACSTFGPDVPTPQPGQPPGRPSDPDSTGGYYQPVRILTNGQGTSADSIVISETRIACGVASASSLVVSAFAQRYHLNENPAILSFGPTNPAAPWVDSSTPANAGAVNDLPGAIGKHVDLEVAWPACPTSDGCGDGVCGPDETAQSCASCDSSVAVCPRDCMPPKGCAGAERYVLLDQTTGALTDSREGISIAWYATGGAFDNDRTGRDATDLATASDNGWTAPSSESTVTLWVVLLDDRGGTSWGQYVVHVH